MRRAWHEIDNLFRHDTAFLGLDTSVAPLFTGHSSLVYLIESMISNSLAINLMLALSVSLRCHDLVAIRSLQTTVSNLGFSDEWYPKEC